MRVFTVLGPSQSGKTTLVAALVGLDGHGGKSFETAGATSVRRFSFLDEEWAAIDVAGGADNLPAVGPALAASDAAVLCVPAEADAAVLTAPYLRMIEEAGIPCIIFLNRMDRATDRVSEMVASLQAYCRHGIVLRQVPIREGEQVVGAVDLISERAWQYREDQPSALIEIPEATAPREREARSELLEALADYDDHLLEELIEDKQPLTAEIYDVATKVLKQHALVPALMGCALHRNGVLRLMKSLRHEAPQVDVARARLGNGTAAIACHADVVKHLGKVVVLRALDGEFSSGDTIAGGTIGSLAELDAKSPVASVAPGDIALTVKTDHLGLGTACSREATSPLPAWAQSRPSAHRRIVTPVHDRDETRLSNALEALREIDPGLSVEPDELTGNAVLGVQGPLHLRRIVGKLADDFGIEVTQTQVPPHLRETISRSVEKHHRHRKQSGGAGQFADVVLEVRPVARGAGFRFTEQVKGGAVPRNYIPAVEAGVREALTEGPNGYPVVDLEVVLKDGKHHAVDSSDHAFRTAGKNAVREALAEAGPVVLQPIMRIEIHVPSVFTGGLVQTVSGLKGQVTGFDAHPDFAGWDVFNCLLPMASLDDLFNALGGATRGTAWFTSEFDHYQEARREELAAMGA
jgi:elongation factor G